MVLAGIQEKTPHKMSSQEKTPQEKTPQKSPVEKTPHPILGLVEKTPRVIFRLVEKTPQLYKKPSFWKFGIFIHLHIETSVWTHCTGHITMSSRVVIYYRQSITITFTFETFLLLLVQLLCLQIVIPLPLLWYQFLSVTFYYNLT